MSESIRNLVRPEIARMSAYQVPSMPGIEVKLDANESPYSLPPERQKELAHALSEVPLNRYPDPQARELRAILASEYGVSEESLLFGNGSDEIIQILLASLSKPREGRSRPSILYPGPTFSVFQLLADALGVDTTCVALSENFELDMPALRDGIKETQPNMVFFARPNNPTGTLWPAADVLALAEEFPETLFVSDEAYGEYATGSLVADQAGVGNLLIMKTLSKIGLAGVRVGFAIADPALIAELNKARAPYNISALNQAAAVWTLTHCRQLLRDQCAEVVEQRGRLATALAAEPDLRVFASEANLLLFRVGEAGKGSALRTWNRLCAAGVLVRKFGSEGPLADCLRVSIGTPAENDRFLSALRSG
jgi:histidinol-phosphate aminotransferase